MEGYKTLSVDDFEKMMEPASKPIDRLKPAFSQIGAAVCIVSSNEYAPFAGVVVRSILANASPAKNYDIVILSDDMSPANRNRIIGEARGMTNASIRVVDINNYVNNLQFYTWAHFTKNTYYRLLTPDIFSKYKKVIYMDSDVVANRDIAELYETDISGYVLAAAYDTHVVSYCTRNPPLEQRTYNMETLKMEVPEHYFQCGVSLYNVEEIHKNYPKGFLIEQATKHQLRWLDQDLVNMLFYGKIKRLPNIWNVMISNVPTDVDELHLPDKLRREYYEARQDPGIIHYVGHAIPCYTTTPDLYEYFWKYARQTCFYEILLQRWIDTIIRAAGVDQTFINWPIVLLQHNIMFAEHEKIGAVDPALRDIPAVLYQHRVLFTDYERRMEAEQKRLIPRTKRLLRRVADVILPKGTRRREWVKKIVKRKPKTSGN